MKILGESEGEPISVATKYYTGKYWVVYHLPDSENDMHYYEIGFKGDMSTIASAAHETKQGAYDSMLADLKKKKELYN